MAPRQAKRPTAPEIRDRNTRDLLGRPGFAGLARIGGIGARGGGGRSVLADIAPDESDPTGNAQLLVLSATGDSIAPGGDYIEFDTIVTQHGFEGVAQPSGGAWVHPLSGVYMLVLKLAWDTFTGGGTIQLEVDGLLVAGGEIVSGTSGSEAFGVLPYAAAAGSVGRILVTHADGSAQACDSQVAIAITDPDIVEASVFSSYAEAVLADGPVAYWRLGEAAGTSAADETGNGHTGTYVGAFTLGSAGVMRDGSGDSALTLPGCDSVSGVTGSDWADLEFTGTAAYSIECWFRTNDAGAVQILVQKQVVTSGAGWELVVLGTGAVAHARVDASSVGTTVSSTAGSIVAGPRYHVVATFDGTTMTLYVNGVSVATAASAVSMGSNGVSLTIGYDPEGGNQFTLDGSVDEVAIYDRALTGVEVAEHYTLGTQAA